MLSCCCMPSSCVILPGCFMVSCAYTGAWSPNVNTSAESANSKLTLRIITISPLNVSFSVSTRGRPTLTGNRTHGPRKSYAADEKSGPLTSATHTISHRIQRETKGENDGRHLPDQ